MMRARISSLKAEIPTIMVCALAMLVVSLNIARPVQTLYQYSANVVASENRFASLEKSQKHEGSVYIRLRPIEDLLNELPYEASVSNAVPNLKVRSVDVFSKAKLTSAELSKKLVSYSEIPNDTHEQEEKSKETRWNRWRISVLEHQIDNSKQFSQSNQSNSNSDEFVESGDSPYKLVSAAKNLSDKDVLASLREELARRKQLDAKNSQADLDSHFAGNGVISLSTPWQIRLATGNSSAVLLVSCFVFSIIAALAITGIKDSSLYKNAKRHHRDDFSRAMHRLNIPVLGVIGNQQSIVIREIKAIEPTKWQNIGMLFYKTFEWILLLSMAISCARLMFDPVWRDLILHSPLAALSCLIYHS